MVLVDTSVWIDHFRKPIKLLADLLNAGHVTTHPFIAGELALGQQKQQELILAWLSGLEQLRVAQDAEVMTFIKTARLAGSGIGYVDAHLIVAATLSRQKVWTRDSKLLAVAARLGLNHG